MAEDVMVLMGRMNFSFIARANFLAPDEHGQVCGFRFELSQRSF
jgi:hypothetical protein